MGICSSLGLDWQHLCPINDWVEDTSGPSYQDEENVLKYIIDETTGDHYFNSTKAHTRVTFVLEATAGIILHSAALVIGTVYRIFRVLSLHAFWRRDDSIPWNFRSRFTEWGADAVRVLISPLGIPCLFLTAVYGIINPRDGQKLHARVEILFHGHPLIALCMHPQPGDAAHNNNLRKFQAMITSTLLIQPLKLVITVVYKVIRFLSFYSFWKRDNADLGEKCFNWIKDGFGIIAAPLGIPLCLAAAVFSIIQPEKGTQLFHKVQKVCYGELLAQDASNVIPIELREHFFGGDANRRDTY